MDLSQVELTASPRYEDLTEIDPRLVNLAREKGYRLAWAPVDSRAQSVAMRNGQIPLTPEHIREWDPELHKSLFVSDPRAGTVPLFQQADGLIRNVDCVLMMMSEERREFLMNQDRQRIARQHARPRTDLDELKEKLEELGVPIETRDSGIPASVRIAGYDKSDLDAKARASKG